jgi:hypothetical protein
MNGTITYYYYYYYYYSNDINCLILYVVFVFCFFSLPLLTVQLAFVLLNKLVNK